MPGTPKPTGAVRLWDVDKVKEVSRLLNLPDPGARRPGLAPWRVGKGPGAVATAIAWGDGRFRVWISGPKEGKLWQAPDGTYNTTAIYLPEPGQVLTGSRSPASGPEPGYGQLSAWSVAADRQPEVVWRRKFPATGDTHYFPWALALYRSNAKGGLDRAAVALRVATAQGEEDRIQTVSVGADAAGSADFLLWKGGGTRTVLAAGNQHLAVGGSRDHAIAIYPLAGLVKKQAKPGQQLRSAGITLRHVAFARKARDLGLLLGETANPAVGGPPREARPGDLVLDFARRTLTAEVAMIDRPADELDRNSDAARRSAFQTSPKPPRPRRWSSR